MAIVFVGIDLAKNVFALHGVDGAGKARLVGLVAGRTASDLPPTAVPLIRQESWGLTLSQFFEPFSNRGRPA